MEWKSKLGNVYPKAEIERLHRDHLALLGPRLDAVEDDGSPRVVNGWLLTRGERGEGMWYHVGTAATQLFAPEGWF